MTTMYSRDDIHTVDIQKVCLKDYLWSMKHRAAGLITAARWELTKPGYQSTVLDSPDLFPNLKQIDVIRAISATLTWYTDRQQKCKAGTAVTRMYRLVSYCQYFGAAWTMERRYPGWSTQDWDWAMIYLLATEPDHQTYLRVFWDYATERELTYGDWVTLAHVYGRCPTLECKKRYTHHWRLWTIMRCPESLPGGIASLPLRS